MIVDTHTHLWRSANQLGAGASAWLRDRFHEPWSRIDASVGTFDRAMRPVEYALILGLRSRMLGAMVSAEDVAGYASRAPGWYLGLAGIDPMEPGYLRAVDEAVGLGLVGVVVSPAAQGFHPSHSRAMRLYERCAELHLPVVVHAGTHLGRGTVLEYAQPHLWDEAARAYPGLRLLMTQAGYPWVEQTLLMLGKHRHLYADLSEISHRPWQLYQALLSAHQLGVTDRLLLGSDYPFSTPEKAIHAIYSVNSLTHGTHLPCVPREQLRGIVERDALTCLGIPAPEPAARGPRPTVANPEQSSGGSGIFTPPLPTAKVVISAGSAESDQ